MKQVAKYKLNFESKWLTASGVMMGLAFFIQAVYYFGVITLQGVDVLTLVLYLIAPMVLETAWCVLLRGVKLNAAGVFGIVGTLVCILLLVQSFFCGNTFQTVISVICYLVAALVLLVITGGFIPYKLPGFAVFAGVLAVRFVVFDMVVYVAPKDWMGLLLELPALCMIASLIFLFGGMKAVRLKKE